MMGNETDRGLVHRILEYMWDRKSTREKIGHQEFGISLSLLEVHNEILYDLLLADKELREKRCGVLRCSHICAWDVMVEIPPNRRAETGDNPKMDEKGRGIALSAVHIWMGTVAAMGLTSALRRENVQSANGRNTGRR